MGLRTAREACRTALRVRMYHSSGALCGTPDGATHRASGVPKHFAGTRVDPTAVAFGGAHNETTNAMLICQSG
eukprot:1857150-Pyramimonas_sp.AAC.1